MTTNSAPAQKNNLGNINDKLQGRRWFSCGKYLLTNAVDEIPSLKEAYDGKVVEGKEVLIREKRKTKRVWLCTNDCKFYFLVVLNINWFVFMAEIK